MTYIQQQKTNKVTAENYFKAWAGENFPYIDEEWLDELKFDNFKDFQLHIYNVFLFTMFYKCIDGDANLPDIKEKYYSDYSDPTALVENNPSKWLEFYQDENSNYFKQITYGGDVYVIMHSGLFLYSSNVYCLFKQNKGEDQSPYKLVAIGNNQESCSCIDFNIAKDIFLKGKDGKVCKPLIYFNDVSDVIFDCTKLPYWYNPHEIQINVGHLRRDHKDRLEALGSGNVSGIESVKSMCVAACQRSITNYRYAYPYLYFDRNPGKILRGFLLPLIKDDEVVLVASVMKEIRRDGTIYNIRTCLEPKMAIAQVRRMSTIEVDWMSQILNKEMKKSNEKFDEI